MKTSDAGLAFIQKEEGTVLKIYKDIAGLETIGVGHLLTADDKSSGRFKDGITNEQALELLRNDVGHAEAAVNDLVKVQLSQNEFDALVSFVFNLGKGALKVSSLLKRLNAGDKAGVPIEMAKWNKAKNPKTKKLEVSKGLAARRTREIALWNKQ